MVLTALLSLCALVYRLVSVRAMMSGECVFSIACRAGVESEALERPLTFHVMTLIFGGSDICGLGGGMVLVDGVVCGFVGTGLVGAGCVLGRLERNCVMSVFFFVFGFCFLIFSSSRFSFCCRLCLRERECFLLVGVVWCGLALVGLLVGVGGLSAGILSCRCLTTSEGSESCGVVGCVLCGVRGGVVWVMGGL